MRKLRAIRRDGRGVSPVIATILMVAITVVLAAVLYVMVTRLIPPTTGEPKVTLEPAQPVPGGWRMGIAGVSSPENLAGFDVVVLNGSAMAIESASLEDCIAGCSGGGLTLTFTDLTSDGKLNGGDFFVLSGVAEDNEYGLAIIWASSGNKVGASAIQL